MKAFFDDLRTQRIYRIAAGYLVSSWLVLQIASVITSALGLPSWTLKATLALLLMGFGAALLIGWRIDMRLARISPGQADQPSQQYQLIFLSLAGLSAVCGVALSISTFFDATQAAVKPAEAALQSPTATPEESSTPIPDIVLADGTRVSVGDQEILIADKGLGLRSIAGDGVSVLENRPDRIRLLISAGFSTYLIEGTDLKHLKPTPRRVLSPGEPEDFDNGAAEAFAAFRSGPALFAFYQGVDRNNLPADSLSGTSGFYLSIGVAESDDDGKTWVKKGQIIRSEKPKEWALDSHQWGRGIGLAGGVVDKSGKQYYIYYTNLSTTQGGAAGQIEAARCNLDDGPPLPGNWKKYYKGAFSEPGLGGKESPVIDVYASGHAGARYGRPVYSGSMQKYFMVFNVTQASEWGEDLPPKTSGIYLANSNDLTAWPTPSQVLAEYAQRVPGKSLAVAPTIVFDPGDKPAGWLLYAYTSKLTTSRSDLPGTPTYLVGRRIRFTENP